MSNPLDSTCHFFVFQTELKMVKISKDPQKIPSWLKANKQMYPDFISQEPKVSLWRGRPLIAWLALADRAF